MKDCAQIVPKISQEYQNVSNNIELHRNSSCSNNGPISTEIHYFLHFIYFRRFLHTVEVRGSSPLSPTIPFNNLRYPRLKQNVGCDRICALILARKQVYGP